MRLKNTLPVALPKWDLSSARMKLFDPNHLWNTYHLRRVLTRNHIKIPLFQAEWSLLFQFFTQISYNLNRLNKRSIIRILSVSIKRALWSWLYVIIYDSNICLQLLIINKCIGKKEGFVVLFSRIVLYLSSVSSIYYIFM